MKKLISWNVNGLRACMKKGFGKFMQEQDPDIMCVQETKMRPEQADFKFEGYHEYWNSAEKKGYSGTAIFTKEEPLNVTYDIGIEEHDQEGRVITAEYPEFYLVCVYTPNSKDKLQRLEYRQVWEDDFRAYLCELDKKKPVLLCGDLNVAHENIDLKNWKTNHHSAGFTDEERAKFTELLDAGFTDSFRYLYPDKEGAYSWWSYRGRARANNAGWRIDYWVVSDRVKDRIEDSVILSDVMGSDHCPVMLNFSLADKEK